MIDQFSHLIYSNPLSWMAVTFLAGSLIGARLNYSYGVALARRKEFNAVADPVRIELRRQILRVHPRSPIPDNFDAIEDQLRWIKRNRFRVAVDAYKQARQQHYLRNPIYGTADEYTRTDHIEAAIRGVLRDMGRR